MPRSADSAAATSYREGRFDEVEARCRGRLQQNVNDIEACYLLALVSWKSGRMREACELMERAVKLAPDDPIFSNNLGGLLVALSRVAEAEGHLLHALAIQPDYPDALCNLGNARRLLGNFDGAREAYLKTLELAPRMPAAHNNLGLLLSQMGRYAEAEVKFREALAIDPNFAEAWNNLGNTLGDLNKDRDAITALNKALTLRPNYAEPHNCLSQVLVRAGQQGQARQHLLRALALDPDHCGAYHNLGALNHSEGRFVEAQGCYRKALALDPLHLMSYAALIRTRTIVPDDSNLVDKLEQLVADTKSHDDETRSHIHFAIGKARDDLGQFDRAFEHYATANRLKRASLPARYQRVEYEAHVTRMIDRFDRAHFERHAADGNLSELPVLIVGMMRSGTTLVEQILSSHPEIFGAGELLFWAEQDKAVQSITQDLSSEAVAGIAEHALKYLRSLANGEPRVSDKMPHNFLHLGLVHTVFPRARIIHCRRNPVDTCLSIFFQNFPALHPYAYDLEDLASFYEQYLRMMAHWRTIIAPTRLLEIDYEDVVDNQEAMSRRMIEFCGLEWDSRCLSFHDNPRPVRTASSWQVRQPLYKGSVARWKNYEAFIGPLARLLDNH